MSMYHILCCGVW